MLSIAQFLLQLLILEGEVVDLGKLCLIRRIELFLNELQTGLRLSLVIGLGVVLVERLHHRLVLSLRLFKLFFSFSELHGEELDLLVAHSDVLLRIMCHLHLRLEALLDAAFELLDHCLGGLELSFALLKLMTE